MAKKIDKRMNGWMNGQTNGLAYIDSENDSDIHLCHKRCRE